MYSCRSSGLMRDSRPSDPSSTDEHNYTFFFRALYVLQEVKLFLFYYFSMLRNVTIM